MHNHVFSSDELTEGLGGGGIEWGGVPGGGTGEKEKRECMRVLCGGDQRRSK